jgi:hypothetical protein
MMRPNAFINMVTGELIRSGSTAALLDQNRPVQNNTYSDLEIDLAEEGIDLKSLLSMESDEDISGGNSRSPVKGKAKEKLNQ